jgi:alpha-tubulin suppressor-like RCC1 family protein
MSIGRAGYGGDSTDVSGDLSSGVVNVYSTAGAFAALKSDGSVITWGGVEGLVSYNHWLTDGSLNLYYLRDDGLGDSKVGINMNFPSRSVDMSGTIRIGDQGTSDSIFYDFSGSNSFGRASEISGNARDNIRKILTTQYFTLVLYQSGYVYLYTSRTRSLLGSLQDIHGESDIVDIATQEYEIDIEDQLVVAIKRNGTVRAWTYSGTDSIITTLESSTYKYRSVAVGTAVNNASVVTKTCIAITDNGDNQTIGRIYSSAGFPTTIGTNVQQVGAGENIIVYLRSNGTVFMELVYGGTTNYNTAGYASLSNIVKISVGRYHVLALDSNGIAYAWQATIIASNTADTRAKGIGALSSYANIYSRPGVWNIYAGGSHSVLLLRENNTIYACGETVNSGIVSDIIPENIYTDVVRVFAGVRTTFMQRFEPNNQVNGPTQFRDRIFVGESEGAKSIATDHTITLYDTRSHGSAGSIYIGGMGDTSAYSRLILANDISYNTPYKNQWSFEHSRGANVDENHLRIVYIDGSRRIQPVTFDKQGNMRLGYEQDVSGYTHRLDVCGNANITGTITTGNTATVGGNFIVRNTVLCVSGNQVGIGTRNPTLNTTLDVSGNSRVSGNMTITGTTSLQTITLTNGYNIGSYFIVSSSGVGIGTISLQETLTVAGSASISNNIYTNKMGVGKSLVTSGAQLDVAGNTLITGRVGIGLGSAVPTTNALDVYGAISVSDTSRFYNNVGIYMNNSSEVGLDVSGTAIVRSGNLGVGKTNPSARLDVVGTTAINGNTSILGNVGIGKTNPSFALDVVGSTNLAGTTSVAGTATVLGNVGIGKTNPLASLDIVGNSIVSGNIGIGKTNPSVALDVVGNTNVTGTSELRGNVGIGQASTTYALDVSGTARITGNTTICGTLFVNDISGFIGSQWVNNGSDIYYKEGNVGIGISTPTAELDVSGTIVLNTTSYFDAILQSNWSSTTASASNKWTDIVWAKEASGNVGLFVAISSTTSTNQILVSPDGTNWTAYSTPNNAKLNRICWSPELSLFVAVGENYIVKSSTGHNWTSTNFPGITFNSVAFKTYTDTIIGEVFNTFIAVTEGPGNSAIYRSTDGTTWTFGSIGVTSYDIFSGGAGGVFYPLNNSAFNISSVTSGQGILFEATLIYAFVFDTVNNYYGPFSLSPGPYVYNGAVSMYSYDFGETWYLRDSTMNGTPLISVSYSSVLDKYIFVSALGDIYKVSNFSYITYAYLGTSVTFVKTVSYGVSSEYFIMGDHSSHLYISTDGDSWSTITNPVGYKFTSVAMNPDTSKIVSVGRLADDSPTNQFYQASPVKINVITSTSTGLGIQNSEPSYPLDIQSYNSGILVRVKDSTATEPHFVVTNSNIGIGKSNPTSSSILDVNGTATFTQIGIAKDPSHALDINGVLKITGNNSPQNDNDGAYLWNQLNVGPTIAGLQFQVQTGGNNPRFHITSFGNVGIGKTNPVTLLDVNGTTTTTSIGIGKSSVTSGTVLDVSGVSALTSIGIGKTTVTSGNVLDVSGNTISTRIGVGKTVVTSGTVLDVSGVSALTSAGIGKTTLSGGTVLDVSGVSALTSVGIGKTTVTSGVVLDVSGVAALTSVGIGKTNVSSGVALDVSGTVNISGGFMYGSPVNGLGNGVYTAIQYYRVTTAVAGTTALTAQTVFGTGIGPRLVTGFTYEFEGLYAFNRASGSTTHTIGHSFAGTGTISSIGYSAIVTAHTTFNPQTVLIGSSYISSSANTVITSAITGNSHVIIQLKGIVTMSGTGTIVPSYTLSASPGAAYTLNIGSYFKIWPIGPSATSAIIGTWS